MEIKEREELERWGWERRTAEREPRLSELVALYEELGFEVRLLPARPQDFSGGVGEECEPCLNEEALARYKTIYTRRQA
jgi:hypothetical protein